MNNHLNEDFGEQFRSLRDGSLTPEQSFLFRHGPLGEGNVFIAHAKLPLKEIQVTDLYEMLLDAANDKQATDIEIHFSKSSQYVHQEMLDSLMIKLNLSGFLTLSVDPQINELGIGWIRLSLFSETDIYDIPLRDEAGEEIRQFIALANQ